MSDNSDDEQQQTANLTKKELQELKRKQQKSKKKKESKKRTKATKQAEPELNGDVKKAENEEEKEKAEDLGVDIEYVGETIEIGPDHPDASYFNAVFDAFKISTDSEDGVTYGHHVSKGEKKEDLGKVGQAERILQEEMEERAKENTDEKLSRRKLRISLQPSIAKLKETTYRADVVEWADVTSRDPYLLVALKSYRNTVGVPRHWNAKRKYLAGKRGFERPPFELPDFIKRTGIQDMREALLEKEESQSLKSKMRERARPKLGKIDIDYQKLHDAFFKWQTKPMMTKMGELYYEGKEMEAMMRDKKPGEMSDELRIALGMPIGSNAFKFPPPWLIAMQRYGPPPSFPHIKIPGLNAPIPEGCAFGYHAGGWGKPPVDEYGHPLYGDVFGLAAPAFEPEDESQIERRYWGEIGSDESSEEEESEEEDEDVDDDDSSDLMAGGFQTPAPAEGMVTPSGMTTGITGIETPDTIELRKGKESSVLGTDTPALAAYHIIPEKKNERIGGQMMASTHTYDLSKKHAVRDDGVHISLDPESIDMDEQGLAARYEEQLRKQKNRGDDDDEEREDLTDMVAEHAAKQNRKRKVQDDKKNKSSSSSSAASSSGTSGKKHKDFKF